MRATLASSSRRFSIQPWQAAILWAAALLPLAGWGLPTSRYDTLLFGGQPAWPPQRYDAARQAEKLRERTGGADTDVDPLAARDRITDLTADEAGRGAILLRYRLYSRQPDEMITFRALQRMNPRRFDLDPRLYQYGGAYIYLVGAAIGMSSVLGLTHLTSDINYYITQPDAFGRFYVVARLVTLAFAALALLAVYRLGERAAGRAAGWLAMLLVGLAPTFVSGALEAKPHVPAMCMSLWATLSALRFRADHRLGDAIKLGLQAGLAAGLVLTGLAAWLLIPAAWLACRASRSKSGAARAQSFDRRALLRAAGLAVCVYGATNPYIPYNLLFNRAALASNLGNSTAMYDVSRIAAGAWRVIELSVEGGGWLLAALGFVAFLLIARRAPSAAWLSAAPSAGLLVLCAAIGAGKPPEFARFLVLPLAMLAAAVAVGIVTATRSTWARLLLAIVALAPLAGFDCLRALARDNGGALDSRVAAARHIETTIPTDQDIGVLQEPAPYAVPPIDFAHRRVLLLPNEEFDAEANLPLPRWLVFAADEGLRNSPCVRNHYRIAREFLPGDSRTRITWANKPILLYSRKE